MRIQPPPFFRLREELDQAGLRAAIADDHGSHYLVVEMPGRSGPCWICAPATDKALQALRTGHADAWSLIHHSATGTVEIYRTLLDGSVRESVVLCASLPTGEMLLSAA